jgi:23S rRNA (adenine2030-N6)-methyltransferase
MQLPARSQHTFDLRPESAHRSLGAIPDFYRRRSWHGYYARMYSYRHGFHAGNHADVLKHSVLIAILRHLLQKEGALVVIDTHAGAGLYRLDGDLSEKGGEAVDGVLKLLANFTSPTAKGQALAPVLQDYLALVQSFNSGPKIKIYPGSPFVVQSLMRQEARDKLKLFEMHPTDSQALAGNIAQLGAGRQVAVARQDGFEGLKAFLPPPNRRALVLIDPSYEIKSDYAKVSACIQDCLLRFPTGVYAIWYPVIPRPEAHDLPRRLKSLAQKAAKPWLHASLNIGHAQGPLSVALPGERKTGHGLSASGMFIINPPHTLNPALALALPQLLHALGRGAGKGYTLDAG